MGTKNSGKVTLELPVPATIGPEVAHIHPNWRALTDDKHGEPLGKPCGAGTHLGDRVDARPPRDLVGSIGRPPVVVPERDSEVKPEDVPERGVERGREPILIHELEKKRHSLDYRPLAPQTSVGGS